MLPESTKLGLNEGIVVAVGEGARLAVCRFSPSHLFSPALWTLSLNTPSVFFRCCPSLLLRRTAKSHPAPSRSASACCCRSLAARPSRRATRSVKVLRSLSTACLLRLTAFSAFFPFCRNTPCSATRTFWPRLTRKRSVSACCLCL